MFWVRADLDGQAHDIARRKPLTRPSNPVTNEVIDGVDQLIPTPTLDDDDDDPDIRVLIRLKPRPAEVLIILAPMNPADPNSLPTPTLVLLTRGYPGVGKTTLATHLSRRLGFALLCKDDLRDVGCSNEVSYDALWALTKRQTQLSVLPGILIESPLAYRRLYQSAALITPYHLVLDVICSDDLVWEQRLARRKVELDAGLEQDHKAGMLTVSSIRAYYESAPLEEEAMRYAIPERHYLGVVDVAEMTEVEQAVVMVERKLAVARRKLILPDIE